MKLHKATYFGSAAGLESLCGHGVRVASGSTDEIVAFKTHLTDNWDLVTCKRCLRHRTAR